MVWGNGAFFGIDLNYGRQEDVYYYGYYGGGDAFMLGVGFSLGNVYDIIGNDLQFVYGMSVGFWGSGEDESSYNFLGPFVKLRWRFMELTYRGLLGMRRDVWVWDKWDFDWNNHQLMLGTYFATSKRARSK